MRCVIWFISLPWWNIGLFLVGIKTEGCNHKERSWDFGTVDAGNPSTTEWLSGSYCNYYFDLHFHI